MRVLLLIVCCLFLNCAGLAEEPSPSAGKSVVVSDGDNGTQVEAPLKGKLVVRLHSNITTGNQWRLTKCDGAFLRLEGEPRYEGAGVKLPGAGGFQVFTFTAVQAGKTTLELSYSRLWETNKPPGASYKVDVQIADVP